MLKFLIGVSVVCLVRAQCQWNSPDGVYDFSSHGNDVMGPVPDPMQPFYETALAICTDSGSACACSPTLTCSISGASAMATKFSNSAGITNCLGAVSFWEGGSGATWSFIDDGNHGAGVQANFDNGDLCYGQVGSAPAKATVMMQCAPSNGNTFEVTSDNFNCDWTYTVLSSAACGPSGGTGGGLSGGWIFVMIVLIPMFLYFTVGFCYKTRMKGTSGVESVPNIEFWRELPGLVKDGGRFAWSKVRGGSYSNVGSSSGGGGGGGGGDFGGNTSGGF